MIRSILSHSILLIIFIPITGCFENFKDTEIEGSLESKSFKNERFGWELKIPEKWAIISQIEHDYLKESGNKIAKETFKEKAIDTWTPLLYIKKQSLKINQFIVGYSKYTTETHGSSYEESKSTRFYGNKAILERNPGTFIEDRRTETIIDSLAFDTYSMKLFKNGEVRGYQEMYEKIFDNDDIILITILCQEKEVFEEIKTSLLNSKFSRKK